MTENKQKKRLLNAGMFHLVYPKSPLMVYNTSIHISTISYNHELRYLLKYLKYYYLWL